MRRWTSCVRPTFVSFKHEHLSRLMRFVSLTCILLAPVGRGVSPLARLFISSADYNNDGFVDVVISNASYDGDPDATPTLLKNAGNGNNWLTVKLIGTDSNRSAIGALVEVELPGRILRKEVRARSSFLSQDSPWLTFGLNRDRRVDKVRVIWPSGQVEEFRNVRGRRTVTIIEGRGIKGHSGYKR